jgi:hypothetical protein
MIKVNESILSCKLRIAYVAYENCLITQKPADHFFLFHFLFVFFILTVKQESDNKPENKRDLIWIERSRCYLGEEHNRNLFK